MIKELKAKAGELTVKEGAIWKLIACTLLSSAVTGISSWILFGVSRVSKADMESFVQERVKISTLEQDKQNQPFITKLEVISTKMDTLTTKFDAFTKDTATRLDRIERNGKSN